MFPGDLFAPGDFSKKAETLKGRLPPEDGPDRRETLRQPVSDDIAKLIFRASKKSWGRFFKKIENFERSFTQYSVLSTQYSILCDDYDAVRRL